MAETQNNVALLNRKEWQTMMPAPSNTAALTIMVTPNAGFKNVSMLLYSATVQYLYHHDEDAYVQITSGAFGGTWVAGVCGTYTAWSNTYTANGGSTTTVTVAAATHNINGYAKGATIEFLSGTAANIGTRAVITEILNNAGQGTITLTLDTTLGAAVVNTDTFRLNTGRFWIMASGTLAANCFKSFDLATLAWTDRAFATGGTTNGTDARLVHPYQRTSIYATGTATSGSSTTLVNSAKAWANDQWKNYQVRITDGTGKGQVRVITTNTGTQLTFAAGATIDSSSVYEITGDENAIYYLGNNAVTMYKYSISANTWSTVVPTAARASAPILGMTANWVGTTGISSWATENACLDGRYIYSFRPTSSILDRYDIASQAWLATTGVNYVVSPQILPASGWSCFWDTRYLYLMSGGSTTVPCKFFKYALRGNYMEPITEDWFLGGAAVHGEKMWIKDLSTTGTVKWLYYISGTSQIVRRIMLF